MLVPVLAELEVEDVVVHDGHEHTVDKEASAGIVALRAPDGRTALPVFTSVATMAAWRADARPVPSDVARAALSAVTEGWEVLVVDPGGPTTVLVPRPAVWALAQQERWRPAVTAEGVDPEVRDAIVAAVAPVAGVVTVDAVPGTRAEVAVVVGLVGGLDRAGLDAVLAQVNAALAGVELVATRVDSLELPARPAASGGGRRLAAPLDRPRERERAQDGGEHQLTAEDDPVEVQRRLPVRAGLVDDEDAHGLDVHAVAAAPAVALLAAGARAVSPRADGHPGLAAAGPGPGPAPEPRDRDDQRAVALVRLPEHAAHGERVVRRAA